MIGEGGRSGAEFESGMVSLAITFLIQHSVDNIANTRFESGLDDIDVPKLGRVVNVRCAVWKKRIGELG
jgi:hypothetical protein